MARRGLLPALFALLVAGCSPDARLSSLVSEQRHLDIRQPEQLPSAPVPPFPPPATVSNPNPPGEPKELSLDEAIHIALENTKVVRVLAGVTAVSSGKTIYDPAVSNTAIDVAKSVFDPAFTLQTNWTRTEPPQAIIDPTSPVGASLFGFRTDTYDLKLGLTKRNLLGGTAGFNFDNAFSRFNPNLPGLTPLNPQDQSTLAVSYTQPLLKGFGVRANVAPIVIARLDTEITYYQFADSVQELVRGVIEAYWNVVFARTDVWAKKQQVEQGQAAYDRAEARKKAGFGNAADVAQAKVALSNFKANLVGAEGNLLLREDALRNILGLPPTEPVRVIPTTPPTPARLDPKWDEVLQLAEQRRPDLIELRLTLDADEQQLIIARNQAQPQVDASTYYHWNGLSGTTPTGASLASGAGQFTDWSLGLNITVPLGLRQSRADLRKAQLILVRDRANLDQGRHAAVHEIALSVRSIAQAFDQYLAFKETRVAARENLEQQVAEFKAGRTIYLNVLQAISAWGDAVSAEAQALTAYNTELANLERRTGTILETHGVSFYEERFHSVGPLGRVGPRPGYPESVPPGANAPRYPAGSGPAEKVFNLDPPFVPGGKMPEPPGEPLPPPRAMLALPVPMPMVDAPAPRKN
jgi:outer membrane protein TolC